MAEYYAVERSGTSLSHHGILGMKWGIRRYQNKDGSLTAAGRRRYMDTSRIKDRQKKIKKEQQILSNEKIARNVARTIQLESGSWYSDSPNGVTKEFQAQHKKYLESHKKSRDAELALENFF